MGSLQALQSLGSFLGPPLAGLSYDLLGPVSPFAAAAVVLVLVIGLVAGSPLPDISDTQARAFFEPVAPLVDRLLLQYFRADVSVTLDRKYAFLDSRRLAPLVAVERRPEGRWPGTAPFAALSAATRLVESVSSRCWTSRASQRVSSRAASSSG